VIHRTVVQIFSENEIDKFNNNKQVRTNNKTIVKNKLSKLFFLDFIKKVKEPINGSQILAVVP